jgi:hypothetical protein
MKELSKTVLVDAAGVDPSSDANRAYGLACTSMA